MRSLFAYLNNFTFMFNAIFETALPIESFIFYLFNGLTLAGLLFCSALISGAEASFFSFSHKQLTACRSTKDVKEKNVFNLLKEPKRLLATILIVNNFINVAFVTLSTYLLWKIFGTKHIDSWIIFVYTISSAAIIVLFGEIIPKMYASQYNLRFAKKSAPFLAISIKILRPFSSILIQIGYFFEKNAVLKNGYDLSTDKLQKALAITTEKIDVEREKTILKGVVNFTQLTAKQIMRSRMEIVAIGIQTNFQELINVVRQPIHSRLPVYKETIDQIEGLLYIKDLLPHLGKDPSFQWQSLIRKSFFVPENKKIDRLFFELQKKRVHIAIVVDEYGGTSGLITLEDIIEEIIGDITDEFEQEEENYKKIDEHNFVFESKISLNDFCKIVNESPTIFEEVKGESESLGGLLLEIHGQLPTAGQKVNYRHFVFTAIAVDTRKIKKIQVRILPKQEDSV